VEDEPLRFVARRLDGETMTALCAEFAHGAARTDSCEKSVTDVHPNGHSLHAVSCSEVDAACWPEDVLVHLLLRGYSITGV